MIACVCGGWVEFLLVFTIPPIYKLIKWICKKFKCNCECHIPESELKQD